jgi:flagellar hook assembly protein FlgD
MAPDGLYRYQFEGTEPESGVIASSSIGEITLKHITISEVSASPLFIDPYRGQSATIRYTLAHALDLPMTVVVRIYDAPTKQLVKTLTAAYQLPGVNAVDWDGTHTSGTIVPLEAYYFTIQASDASGTQDQYNDATNPLPGPTPSHSNYVVNATNFDPYQNDLVAIHYEFSAPGRLTIRIITTSGQTIRTLLPQAIRGPGPQVELWDGRGDDGTVFEGSFNVFFDVPVLLPLHPIVVSRDAVGFENFRAEAYLIQPVFAEVSTLTYTLTAPPPSTGANVTIALINPNGNQIRTLVANAFQPIGPQTLEWDGRDDDGQVVSVEGVYTVSLTGEDPESGFESTRLGAITVYK